MTTIDPTQGTTAAAAATAPRPDEIGKDAFLKLLVAQLKYQDPLKPADGAEFMAQTAQFHMVEKLEELSSQNAELLASQRTLAGSSLIGSTVTYPGAGGIDETGVVDGVRLTADGPVLRVGSEDVPLGAVKEVAPTVAETTVTETTEESAGTETPEEAAGTGATDGTTETDTTEETPDTEPGTAPDDGA